MADAYTQQAREVLAARFDKDEVTAAAARRLRADNETAVEAAAVEALAEALRRPASAVFAAHERDALAVAIGNAAIKAGIVRAGAPMTGPQLVMLCDDMAECIKSYTAPPSTADTLALANKITEALLPDLYGKKMTQIQMLQVLGTREIIEKVLREEKARG